MSRCGSSTTPAAPLPEWRIGRLQISGPPIAKGYYRDTEATRAVFFDDGWFDTGDHGFLANGCLALTGRAKDGIIVNGANYSSAEIESAVESIDGVAASFAAAAAVRPAGQAESAGDFLCASRPRDGAAKLGQPRFDSRCSRRSDIKPDYLVPVRRDDIPKTAIGKIQRAQLCAAIRGRPFRRDRQPTRSVEMGAERTIPDWFSSRTWQPAQEARGRAR